MGIQQCVFRALQAVSGETIATTSPGVDQPWARPCPQKLHLYVSSIRQADLNTANIRVGSVVVYLEIMMRNFGFRRTSRNNLTENSGLPSPNRQELPRRDEQTTASHRMAL